MQLVYDDAVEGFRYYRKTGDEAGELDCVRTIGRMVQVGERMADLCRRITLLAEEAGEPLRVYLSGCSQEMVADVRDWQASAGWLPTPAAARIYGCTDSYMRRLARTRLVDGGHARLRHDGTWEVSCGALRNLRRRS